MKRKNRKSSKKQQSSKIFIKSSLRNEQQKKNLYTTITNYKTYPFRDWDERMCIGRYKGMKLKDVPFEYLCWIKENFELDSSRLKIIDGFIEK